jgi:fumarylpyruvate hydrolase
MQLPRLTVPTVSIAHSKDRFPVRRIYCVGLNYADHAREMGNDPKRDAPFFFSKPADAVVASGTRLAFPSKTSDFHHEVELVVALGAGGSNIRAEDAAALIFGHAVGLDLTRRDLQARAKKAGRPWDLAKGFDHSAPLGALALGIPPTHAPITLSVNGQVRQSGDLADMIWKVPEIIAILSTFIALAPGDLIFTGTPSGVGPIAPGESLHGSIGALDPIDVSFENTSTTPS